MSTLVSNKSVSDVIRESWDFSKPAESEERLRAAARQRSGQERLEVLTQVGRALGLQKRFEDADAALDEVEQGGATGRARVRLLLERGRVRNSSGKPAEATVLFKMAAELAEQIGEENLHIDALHMLAISDADRAVEWSERAMSAAERASDPRARGWLGPLYNNLGWTYHDRGELTRAMELFEKGVRFRAEMKQERELAIARYCVARCLRSMGRADEAVGTLEELIRADETDGYFFEELAECLLLKGEAGRARELFGRAYGLLKDDPWIEKERVERMKSLAGAA